MEQRLHRKGWGRRGWKIKGHPWLHGYSRLPKIPAEGKTTQKTETVWLSVNKLPSTKASWSWSLWTKFSCFIWDPFAASAPGFVYLSSVCLHLSITARSSHLWWTQERDVIAHGAVSHADGLMLSQTWIKPPMSSSKVASSYSFHPSINFSFDGIFWDFPDYLWSLYCMVLFCCFDLSHLEIFLGPEPTIPHFLFAPRVSLHTGIFPCLGPNK